MRMMSSAPPPRLSDGKQRRLLAQYQDAHRAFARGQFTVALRRYQAISEKLRPYFAQITARNLGVDGRAGDLSDDEVRRVLTGIAPETFERMQDGAKDARIASLCSAVAHDVALIARHLAESHSRGREPAISQAIIAGFAHAIAVNPANSVNYHNLAGYEDFLGLDAAASEHYRAAVQLEPRQYESWVSWGHALARTGNRSDAETCWANALQIANAIAAMGATAANERAPLWPIAMLRLLKGDYAGGWLDYEGRLSFPPYVEKHGRPDLSAPRWDGRELAGTVLIHQEQGVGDAIMLARYIPLVAQRVDHVIVEVISGMASLFEAMLPGVQVVAKDQATPAHDAQLPMFSLPHVFGTTMQSIPDLPRFEVQSAENVSIQAEPGRIGLCWRGSASHPNDLVRSMRFEDTFALLDVPGLTWQSLQFGYETSAPLDSFVAGDFLETARLIARCSLVITVDTSIAHLAGAMGVPTWVLLPINAEWRWLQDRRESPWYPSVSLYRQDAAGNWSALTKRVAEDLQSYQHGHQSG